MNDSPEAARIKSNAPLIAAERALDAVDALYDLMQGQSTAGQRIDAKIALKNAILALASLGQAAVGQEAKHG